MLENEKSNQRMKQTDVRYYFMKDLYQSNNINYKYCLMNEILSDILTNPLCAVKIKTSRKLTGLGLSILNIFNVI